MLRYENENDGLGCENEMMLGCKKGKKKKGETADGLKSGKCSALLCA